MNHAGKRFPDAPLLSVLVPVCNHAPWIRQCIDSIREQKVNFDMEVLIADDASTDGTREILKKIEGELISTGEGEILHKTFRFIYRDKRIGPFLQGEDLYRRAKGKYLIVLEGDDYWTYGGKLQAQVDFLESRPAYTACAHRVTVVDRNGQPTGRHYPECRHRDYTFADWCLGVLPGQTASLMFRNHIVPFTQGSEPDISAGLSTPGGAEPSGCDFCGDESHETGSFEADPRGDTSETGSPDPDSFGRPDRRNDFLIPADYPRDQVKAFLLVTQGKVACFPDKWSAYRYHPEDSGTFSSRGGVPWQKRREFYQEALRWGRCRLSAVQRLCLRARMAGDRICCIIKK